MSTGSKSHKLLRRHKHEMVSAFDNPDSLVRRLLKPQTTRSRAARNAIWPLLQDLGGSAVVKRAAQAIARSRATSELQAVLKAAGSDEWTETGAAVAKRFEREIQRLGARRPGKDQLARIEALCDAAAKLHIDLNVHGLRKLLHHSSARLRSVAAQYAQKSHRADLHADVLPINSERGPGGASATLFLQEFGNSDSAAALWPRALAARKAGNARLLHHYLNLLGTHGAFDILVALRVWTEEDFAKAEAAGWNLAESWCALVRAKLAAGDCTPAEALGDLRWFLHIAEKHAAPGTSPEGEGVFHLARAFALMGDLHEAERLTHHASKRSLPNPERFPELLGMARRSASVASAPTAWLAAAGDVDAQRKVTENWPVLLREGRKPVNWDLRSRLDEGVLREVLSEALKATAPAAVRRVLKFISGDTCVKVVRAEIKKLAADYPSKIVRWKAERVLAVSSAPVVAQVSVPYKWTRLDAAVLSGAPKKVEEPRKTAQREEKPVTGINPPEREGRGWTLEFETLRQRARDGIVASIQKAPLARAVHRRAPLGPSYEERPDVRAVRELAPATTSLDEQMREMATAVMEFWVYGEEPLTLDVNGIMQIAAFLSTANVTMDAEDVTACGAFIGEALRKRVGGEWNGFDENYLLHVKNEVFDPIGLARRLFEKKDPYQGTVAASEMFIGAENRLNPPRKPSIARDTGASFERAIRAMCELPMDSKMSVLLDETRIFTYRMEPADWSAVLAACDTLLENQSGARIAAAVAVYAPGAELARAWARWGAKKREACGLPIYLAQAMAAAAERDETEAMPEWTVQVPATRFSFLNALRKRMSSAAWKKVLMLLLRQRATAGDVAGVGWCLFSYKYEHADCLPLLSVFCDMSVASRQTVLRATRHCTRDEIKLFRPLWAEGLRDASAAVVLAALDAVVFNRAKSLRHLVLSLKHDKRDEVKSMATAVLDGFSAK